MALKERHQRFVEEYCVDFNGAEAARRAGYSPTRANRQAYVLLRREDIRSAIDARLDELSMSAAEVTKRLTDWGRGTLAPFLRVSDDGERFWIDLASEEAQQYLYLIKKVKAKRRIDDDGATVEWVEVELHDAKDAVIQMGKIRGLFVDKHEHSGPDGGPLPITVQIVNKPAEK